MHPAYWQAPDQVLGLNWHDEQGKKHTAVRAHFPPEPNTNGASDLYFRTLLTVNHVQAPLQWNNLRPTATFRFHG